MTKKKFTLLEDTNGGLDTILETMVKDNGKFLTHKECCDLLNHLHEENEKLKLHLHILEEVVYMLDQEVVRAMEDGFESSDWYQNYLAKGTEDLE